MWSARWASLISGHGCKECVRNRYIKEGWKRQVTKIPKSDKPSLSNKGVLSVSCKTCGKRFTPSVHETISRIRAYEGKVRGENNFYCGLKCKSECLIYNFKPNSIDPRSKLFIPKTEQEKARACQTTSLKENQCDSKGYNYCEKCGDIIDVELHHTFEVAKHGKDAINSAGHILLCAGCHVKLHKEC